MKQKSIITDFHFKTLSNNLNGRLKTPKCILVFLLSVFLISSLGSCKKEITQSVNRPASQSARPATQTTASNSANADQSKSVTFTLLMDFSTNPAFGTFTATGTLTTSGSVEFQYNPNKDFITAHNVITLTANEGTITIHDECEFAVDQAFPFGRGSWQIAGGTGAYANIMGNGAESFPSSSEDILSGIIH